MSTMHMSVARGRWVCWHGGYDASKIGWWLFFIRKKYFVYKKIECSPAEARPQG
jgi:hypothetical protein